METKENRSSELELLRGTLLREIDSEGMRLKVCLIATFVLGLIAHGYGLLNFTINHDSLEEFYWAASKNWKIGLGRFMEPILRYFMGEIMVLPWLTGLAGLLFAGLAVHVISKMFSLDTVWENILLSGICVTNVVITALIAAYLHDFAGNMLALLLASLTAYFWSKMRAGFSWKYTLLGAVCLGISFGFYQAYLAVMITLLCLDAILELMKGSKCWTVIRRLLRAIPMGIAAIFGYFAGAALIRKLLNIQVSQAYDLTEVGTTLTNLMQEVLQGYLYVLTDLFVPDYGRVLVDGSVQAVSQKIAGLVCLTNAVFLLFVLFVLIRLLRKKKVAVPEFLFVCILILLLPACMMSVSIVSKSYHYLTRYAVFLFPVCFLLIFKYSREQNVFSFKKRRWEAAVAAIVLILTCNIQISNTAYVKKDIEQKAALSAMTRILSRLEQYEEYDYGNSTVAVVGEIIPTERSLSAGAVDCITGLTYNNPITSKMKLQSYCDIMLQYPLNLCTNEEEAEIVASDAFRDMPQFPDKGCIATINGVIVVKLGEESLYY